MRDVQEAALAAHLLALAPTPRRLGEAGALAELLVLLGHAPDAAVLQAALSALVAAQAAAAAYVAAHPAPAAAPAGGPAGGPAAAAEGGAGAQAEAVAWKWDVLRAVKPDAERAQG